MKDTIIIGHGPSLFKAGLGEFIDSHKNVIRIVNFLWQDKKNYGSKVDYISLTEGQFKYIPLFKTWTSKIIPKELWIGYGFGGGGPYPPPAGRRGDNFKEKYKKHNPVIFNDLPFYWRHVAKHRFLATPKQFSSGFLAVMTACSHLRPKQITIAGFDNIKKGNGKGYQSGDMPHALKDDDLRHDWKLEKDLINAVAYTYKVKVEYL